MLQRIKPIKDNNTSMMQDCFFFSSTFATLPYFCLTSVRSEKATNTLIGSVPQLVATFSMIIEIQIFVLLTKVHISLSLLISLFCRQCLDQQLYLKITTLSTKN